VAPSGVNLPCSAPRATAGATRFVFGLPHVVADAACPASRGQTNSLLEGSSRSWRGRRSGCGRRSPVGGAADQRAVGQPHAALGDIALRASAALAPRAAEIAAVLGTPIGEVSTGVVSGVCWTAAAGIPTLDGLGPVSDLAHPVRDLAGPNCESRPAAS
jgi:hypothetical protein